MLEIEKFKSKGIKITNDIALYYLAMGSEQVVAGIEGREGDWDEGFADTLIRDIEKKVDLSKEDKQEIWEVLLLMVLKHENNTLGLRRYVAGVNLKYLTHNTLAREWDVLLSVYNNEVMGQRMEEYLNGGETIQWGSFKEYYSQFKETLGRDCYALIPENRVGIYNAKYTITYDGECFAVNRLDEVIAKMEERYPELRKGNIAENEISFRGMAEVQRMVKWYKSYCQIYFRKEM